MKLSAKIGAVEIVGDEIRIAVVKSGKKVPRLLEVSSTRAVYHDEEERSEAFALAVRQLVGQLKVRPTLFVLCAPSAWTVVRILSIPFRRRARVAAAVPFELEPCLALPIEDLAIDFAIVGEVDKETEVLVVGMRREKLEEYVALLERGGISVEGVGLDAAGLTSLWQSCSRGISGARAVLHVRDEGAVVAIVRGKRLSFLRHLAIPSAHFHEQPRAAAREVANVIRGFSASRSEGAEVESVDVTGTRFFDEERSLFEEALQIPVHYECPVGSLPGAAKALRAVEDDGDEGDDGNKWAACIGVADASAGGGFAFNFSLDRQSDSGARRSMMRHTLFTACLALSVLAGYVAYCYADYRKNLDELEAVGERVWEEYAATFPDAEAAKTRPAGDVGGFRSFELMRSASEEEADGGRGGPAVSLDTFSRPTLLDILADLAERVPDEKASITNLKVTVRKTAQITIFGEVKDSETFNEILASLERSTVFNVDLDKLEQSSRGGVETFILTARN